MPDINDYHAYKSTGGGSDGGSGGGSGGRKGGDFGCGWIVIVVVAYALIHFIANGASWDAIDRLLGFGLIAFLFARSLFR